MSANKIDQLSNFKADGNFTFNSDFDSGNLLKVECIKKPNGGAQANEPAQTTATTLSNDSQQQSIQQTNGNSSTTTSTSNSSQSSKVIDYEFNVWTRPDCFSHGSAANSESFKKCKNTECNGACANAYHGNRTWFFFSIRGGEKNQLVKFNFMNLNKQAKLFSQGMHPVTRHGTNGKWERIKDKPTFIITEDSFILSFCHRTGENVEDNLTFYAFTFPYTYTEHLQMLDSYDRKHSKNQEDIDGIVRELRAPNKERIVIDIHPTANSFSSLSREDERSQQKLFGINSMSEDAHDGTLLQEKFENFLLTSRSFNSSLDGDNTSDSMQQLSSLVHNSMKIEKTAECTATITKPQIEELKSEIYYYRELLVQSVEQRRVDLLTITSFEGIEDEREERMKNLFPDFSTPRCHKFKNKKIIFLSSRVHPGETVASFVLNGFINLLLDRKSQVASILRKLYVFKIIPFLNPDGVANGLYRSDTLGHNLNRVYLTPRLDRHPSIYAVRKLIRYYHYGCDKPDGDELDKSTVIKSGAEDGCAMDEKESIELASLINELKEQEEDEEGCVDGEDALMMMIDKDPRESNKKLPNDLSETKMEMQQSTVNSVSNNNNTAERKPHIAKSKTGNSMSRKLKDTVKGLVTSDRKTLSSRDEKSNCHHHHYKHMISHYNCEKATEKVLQQMSNSQQQQQSQQQQSNLNISLEYRIKADENGEKSINDESSNLFLYLDMHGHASKKGVFMYGNHLSNTMEAVEVMLLPKLMSLNCHHFHFDACNFSERNMYLKGRRDGLSKEGSGRVAIYKATGLIKSYTLESNYNMAKCVNVLPPKGKEMSCKIHNMIPPKFTPAILEDVGKALGPSLLDLTNSNPVSRIPNSEFRSLQGLRNALKNEINRGLSRARVSKYAKVTKKRQSSIISSSNEIKENENKGSFSSSSLNVVTNSSPTSSSSLSVAQSKPQISSVLKVAASISSTTASQSTATSSTGTKKVVSAFMKKDSKKKILRENVTAATALANSQLNLSHHNHHQIPHKKIRVSGIAGNTNNSNVVVSHSHEKESFESDLVPCCSRSIPAFSIYTKAPSSPSSGSATSSNSGQVKVTSFMPIKKTNVAKYSAKPLASSKKVRSENVTMADGSVVPTFQTLSEKLIKKKKRLLAKSDTATVTLKRKKSRPQKPLV